MQDLIDRLMAEGLTEKQAYKAIEVIKNFAKVCLTFIDQDHILYRAIILVCNINVFSRSRTPSNEFLCGLF